MIGPSKAKREAEAARIAAMSPEEKAAMEDARIARRRMDDAVEELKKSLPWLECGEDPFVKIVAAGSAAELHIGRGYAIKDGLKAEGYAFEGYGKMWVKSFTSLEDALAEVKRLEALKVTFVR